MVHTARNLDFDQNGVYHTPMDRTNPLRNIIVTGSSRGIGQACAVALARPGVRLILHARSENALTETATACQALGAETVLWPLDLADVPSIEGRIQALVADIGPIHTLVNNAGIWLEEPFMDGSMAAWDEALDVNLKAVIHLCRHTATDMPDGGAMVFIASTASKRTYAGGTNYCAAKFGVLGFAGALFEDIRARGIKVCSIVPGVVNTDMHAHDDRLRKELMVQPSDIAQAVVYVLNTPPHICPTELVLQPQRIPKINI